MDLLCFQLKIDRQPTQYCKAIILQLKINELKKNIYTYSDFSGGRWLRLLPMQGAWVQLSYIPCSTDNNK